MHSDDRPYLFLQGVGDVGNQSWFADLRNGHPFYGALSADVYAHEIDTNRLLFVASHYYGEPNDDGVVITPDYSSTCKDVDYGCLWTRNGASDVAASLASILSIFPDTRTEDLAKLARACAKKTGLGIDGPKGLLATAGGFGVADFTCMDDVLAASADLQGNDTAFLYIDGREITVTSTAIAVTETSR